MNKFPLTIAVLIFTTGIIFPQNENKNYLDSLFNEYVRIKSLEAGTKLPSIQSYNQKAIKCGFPLYANIKLNFNNFSPEQKAIISKLDARPDLQKSIASPYGHFRIHYDTTGNNTPGYDGRTDINAIINDVAKILDSVYNFEVIYLIFPEPPKDNGAGGDDLFDIYIINLGSYYGLTTPETQVGNALYSSYIEIDNSFSGSNYYTHGLNAAKVTLAHEFHHAIQMGNYGIWFDGSNVRDLYFYEMTSVAMEDFVFSSVNDYYNYLRFYFNNPQKSFSQFSNDEIYGLGIWDIFLREEFDFTAYEIIKRQWELLRQSGALSAINLSLAEHQTSFKDQLNVFGIWCYFTGYRKIDEEYFTEGANYPLITPTYKMDFTPNEQSWYISVKPLSNNYLRILSDNGTYIDTIYSIITNGDFGAGLNTPGSDFQAQYSFYNYQTEGSTHIANNYYSKLTSSNPEDYREADVLNNKLANGGTSTYAVIDYAFPNPFRYTEYSSLYLPVEYNKDKTVRYYIYSIGMNLICSGVGNLITLYDKFVLQWNGMDNNNKKLPSGVYIYITDSADNIKKGKIVIFNE